MHEQIQIFGGGGDNSVFQGSRIPPPCKVPCTFRDFTWFLTKAKQRVVWLLSIKTSIFGRNITMFDDLFSRLHLPNAPELRYMYQLRIEVHLLHVCCAFMINFNKSIMGIHLSRHVASFIKKEGGGKTTPNKQKTKLNFTNHQIPN